MSTCKGLDKWLIQGSVLTRTWQLTYPWAINLLLIIPDPSVTCWCLEYDWLIVYSLFILKSQDIWSCLVGLNEMFTFHWFKLQLSNTYKLLTSFSFVKMLLMRLVSTVIWPAKMSFRLSRSFYRDWNRIHNQTSIIIIK